MDQFQRSSVELRLYLEYIYQLKRQYGSVLSYIQHERLHWESVAPSGDLPFTNATDSMIIYNDWPYYIDKDITHLVVWTKFPIDENEVTGEVMGQAKSEIDAFVTKTFCSGERPSGLKMDRERIRWFKNWKSLKSVHALGESIEWMMGAWPVVHAADSAAEHFHIMLYRAPAALVADVTNGDRPRSESWIVTKRVM